MDTPASKNQEITEEGGDGTTLKETTYEAKVGGMDTNKVEDNNQANGNGDDDDVLKAEEGTYVSLQDVTKTVPAEPQEETDVLKDMEADVKASQENVENEKQEQPAASGPGSDLLQEIPREASQLFTSESPPPDTVEEELHELMEEIIPDAIQSQKKRHGSLQHASTTSFGKDADKLLQKARLMHFERRMRDNAKDTYDDFKSFLSLQKSTIWTYLKRALLIIFVGVGVAAGIFYLGDQPDPLSETASISWLILFFAVRQVITWSLAKATEAVLIDFLCLRHPVFLAIIGPYLTLLLVQSKGFPFHLMAWAGYNFALLFGDRDFSRHWMFYQTKIAVFSPLNPAGQVTNDRIYMNLVLYAFIVGGAFTLKRFFMGLYYGRTVYDRFGKDLTKVLRKSVLLKKLAKFYSENKQKTKNGKPLVRKSLDGMDFSSQFGFGDQTDEESDAGDDDNMDDSEALIDFENRDKFTSGLAHSQRMRIQTLLGEWEEPEIEERKKIGKTDISAIVQFRTAITCIDKHFPFSTHFGLADTRENAIDSAQKLYLRLKKDPDAGSIPFTQIAVIALKDEKKTESSLDEAMVKELIKLFRPTRDGQLNMLDFIKSTDAVYKDLRMLQASILNLQKMQNAVQRLWNSLFYIMLVCIFLLALGINPFAVITSFTAVIVGFSFMVGNALSKTFEGLLFVLLRKPYDVGDRIAVAAINQDAPGGGSSGWVVKDVDLYTTTLVYGTTGEEATYTNGYLNGYRIINMNRSPKAALNFVMKFGIKVSKDKVQKFGEEIEQYVKSRPREWLAFSAYRLTDVAPDCGYVEYKVILQHRESWQQIGALLASKADVQQFAFQLTKDLDMGYQSPPMPIIVDKNEDGAGLDKLF